MATGQPPKSRKRLYPRRRIRSTGAKTTGDGSTHGLAYYKVIAQRSEEIRNVLDQAMRSLPNADWSKNSPEIVAAQEQLDEAVTKFVQGDITLIDVKDGYKPWAKLHQTQSGEQP